MKYPVIIAAALTAAFAGEAHAQAFDGVRVEARLGWEQVGADAALPNPDEDEDEAGDELLFGSDEDSDATFGLELGYDARIGSSFVVGAYAGADFSDNAMCGELIEDDRACTSLKRTFTLGARAGVPIGETALVYVKGGYSNGRFKTSYDVDVTDNDDDEPGVIEQFSGGKSGYHLGGGVELGLTRNLYAKVEYVYTDFGTRSHLLEAFEDDDGALSLGSDRHQVVAAIGLRF